MKKAQYLLDQIVWVVWLYCHPLKHQRLVHGSEEDYQKKRSEIIRRFRGRVALAP